MTASKSERLVNLVIMLLSARTYVPKERIREVIEGYRDSSDDAFDKMFERDKEELRALGVPIELGHADPLFDDEPGYRIRRDAFELPDIDLEPDEVAVLGLAARVWQHAGLAAATSQALVKLRAAGFDVDREAIDELQPTLGAQEPAFDAMWEATTTRTPVRFGYRRPRDTEPQERRLEPWGVVTSRDRWYVVGRDVERGEPRMFRLSRVVGDVRKDGRPGSYDVPAGIDLRELTGQLAPTRPEGRATLLVRKGRAALLRRRAITVAEAVDGPDGSDEWDEVEVALYSRHELAGDLLSYLGDVVAVAPQELRDEVVRRLERLAGVDS